jgi:hypothetical protein
MSPVFRALIRFWWLPVAGAIVGVVAAAALISRQPPPVYTATDNVLVTSPNSPYLRTAQMQIIGTSTKATTKGKKKRGAASGTSTSSVPPDTQVLVNAANLYPLLIQSDGIRKLRESLYGPTPGRLTASALASSTNTYGVYHPSPLPVIVVKTTSRRPASASKLADDTVRAFGVWLLRRQVSAGIPKSQRITIEQLRVRVTATTNSKLGLPLFAGVVVLLAFCGLALVADRARARREDTDEGAAPVPHRRVA